MLCVGGGGIVCSRLCLEPSSRHPPPPPQVRAPRRGSPRKWAPRQRDAVGRFPDGGPGAWLWNNSWTWGAPRVPPRPWHWPEKAQESLGCPWAHDVRPNGTRVPPHPPPQLGLPLASPPGFFPLSSPILPPNSQFPPPSSSLALSRFPPPHPFPAADCLTAPSPHTPFPAC